MPFNNLKGVFKEVEKAKNVACPVCGGRNVKVAAKSDDPNLPWKDLLCKCGYQWVVEK